MVPVFFIIGNILVRAVAKKVVRELAARGAKRIAASAAAKMKDAPINATLSNLDKLVKGLSSKPNRPTSSNKPPTSSNKPPTIRKSTQPTVSARKDNLPTRGGSGGGAPTVSTSSPKSGSGRRAGDNAKDVTPSNITVSRASKPKDPVNPSKTTTRFNPQNFVRITGGTTLLGRPQVARSEDNTIKTSNKAKISSSGGSTTNPKSVSKAEAPSKPNLSVLKVPESVVSEVEIKTKPDKSSNKKKETPKKKDLSTFGKAFKTARAKGKGTKFTHNDKKYIAITKDDLKKMDMTFTEYLNKKKKK